MSSVDKAVFSRLLAKLWPQLNPAHAVNGFKGTGLHPPDREAVAHRIIGSRRTAEEQPSTSRTSAQEPQPSTSSGEAPETPRKILRKSIMSVLSPPQTETTKATLLQKTCKRKRVQAKAGEVLTEKEVLERLEQEAKEREEKSKKKENKRVGKKTSVTEKVKRTGVKRTLQIASDSSDHSDDDDSDLATPIENEVVQIQDIEENKTYVIVRYEGSYFPGLVIKVGKQNIRVKCMCKSGPKYWRWPDRPDTCDYPEENVVAVIGFPQLMDDRGQYLMPEVDKYWC